MTPKTVVRIIMHFL
ncbi:hypothetical protein LINGRAPRIM_LOCUS3427 [Linum grandiflorum]